MTRVPDFEALYRSQPDPWRVGSSFYEQRKLDLVLAVLSRRRYHRAWDPASGTGHLAARLSERCEHVLATDLVPSAVRLTRQACVGLDNVAVRRWTFPVDGLPDGAQRFDLVLLAEFVYYLPEAERAAVGGLLDDVTTPDAEVLAVHWRPEPHDAWLSGAAVQQEIAHTLNGRGWRLRYQIDDPEFALAGWRRDAEDPKDDTE